MVKGLNEAGLRVVHGRGLQPHPGRRQDTKSILDRVVPGYYQRLRATGQVETSTCCSNTATEHAMMEKLMIDSVVTWAKQYKVDGFRFDLMGHQPKAAMVNLRARARRAHPAQGRRGRQAIYLYGEGWNFGEVGEQRPVRPGHPARDGRHRDRHLQRSASRRGPRRRPVRRESADPGLRLRAVHRPQRRPGQRHRRRTEGGAAAEPGPDQGRADRQPAGLHGSSTAPGRRSPAPTSTTTVSPPGTPAIRRRSSTTSRRTTTRRCSTPWPTNCRRAPRWPTGSGCRPWPCRRPR